MRIHCYNVISGISLRTADYCIVILKIRINDITFVGQKEYQYENFCGKCIIQWHIEKAGFKRLETQFGCGNIHVSLFATR